jgi:isopentenyl-diphosphate delta-isomerase
MEETASREAKPSPDEIFDLVNENDEVIGRMPRAQVHREGRKHRAVHVLIFNRGGEIFLQKRALAKDNFPGLWDSSASGHLDSGEEYDRCAVRETREELGLTLAGPPPRLFYIAACAETGQEFVWVYRAESEGPFVLQPEEIETGGWFTPAAVDGWLERAERDFAPGFVKIWSRLRERA